MYFIWQQMKLISKDAEKFKKRRSGQWGSHSKVTKSWFLFLNLNGIQGLHRKEAEEGQRKDILQKIIPTKNEFLLRKQILEIEVHFVEEHHVGLNVQVWESS